MQHLKHEGPLGWRTSERDTYAAHVALAGLRGQDTLPHRDGTSEVEPGASPAVCVEAEPGGEAPRHAAETGDGMPPWEAARRGRCAKGAPTEATLRGLRAAPGRGPESMPVGGANEAVGRKPGGAHARDALPPRVARGEGKLARIIANCST